MANTSDGKGQAYDPRVSTMDDVGVPDGHLDALVTEAEIAYEGALAKIEKQKGHLKAAEASAAVLRTELTRARKAATKAK